MTHVSELFALEDLVEAIDGGLVSQTWHPTLPLSILNYTPACQYSRTWNDVTTQCRGLIIDDDGEVIARPFPKFFNLNEPGQYTDIPDGDPLISEKMDGSLGIIYTYNGEVAVATRGSFTSDQAIWATTYLHDTDPDFAQPEGVTMLVEILYKANRVVVEYGDREGLVLIGAIDNATGADIPILDVAHWDQGYWSGPVAEHFPYTSLEDSITMATGDDFAEAEGVVLCWLRPNAPSLRIKVKHPRYVELHRIITGLSTRTVHKALANHTYNDLIANVPDEFHSWIKEVADFLNEQAAGIHMRAEADLEDARWCAAHPSDGRYSRKDLARVIQRHALYPGLCFALEDGKDISPRIWDMIRPERETARILEDDDEG